MGIAKGIKAIQEKTAPKQTVEYVKAKWLSLKDGDDVTIRFVNELDADSPNYDPARGLALVVDEHQAPGREGYKRHALCTVEEFGKCWACDQRQINFDSDKDLAKAWRSKQKFYINVLVDDGKTEPYVAVWSMGTYRNDKYTMILDHFLENGSITNLTWRLKRSGSMKDDTTYTFYPKAVDTKPFKWDSNLEVFDIENDVLRLVPYDEQARFYGFADAGQSEALSGEEEGINW